MPLFAVPHGQNDGGYAVSDYRAVNPDIGSMQELAELAKRLRKENISLVLDFVFNHTSDEHRWALKAKDGDPDYQAFYHIFPDRSLPDQYQYHLRDIFPTIRKGNFTFNEGLQQWIWTTFNSYQWDLNYANAEVFRAMAEEMLFLANQGVNILRLDAVAFIWKKLGTTCENLPEAHWIIRAFNCLSRIAAPSLLFKSEAIVAPNDVIQYVDLKECQLSYNPLLMALLWESLATRKTTLLAQSMRRYNHLPKGCAWVNYLRCHDDIGWTFDDEDARYIGINPEHHRHFLNQFYTGQFEGSFAKGVPFQYNPYTGDLRISGTLASLAGLEQALEKKDAQMIEMAVRRINLLRSIMLSAGGIPLIYLGDEWGMVNDYTYLSDPSKTNDSRWVHRSRRHWEAREGLTEQDTLEWRFFNEMVELIRLRKSLPALWNAGMQVIDTDNDHLFGYLRQKDSQYLLIINNFSEETQHMHNERFAAIGMDGDKIDLISGIKISRGNDLILEGYRFAWFLSIDLP
ncbi:MAG: amylosucrase, partial [Desulfobacteraceae bacterium]|jgi:amylosucrase